VARFSGVVFWRGLSFHLLVLEDFSTNYIYGLNCIIIRRWRGVRMLGEIGSGMMFKPLLVGILVAAIILFSFPLKVNSRFEEWVVYVPSAGQVDLDYWAENDVSYMKVLIVFPSSGYRVTDWGTPNITASTISVDAQIWDWTGFDLQVITPVSHAYNLGKLPAGEYVFIFSAWGFPVKETKFTVSVLLRIGGEAEFRGKVVADEEWGDFVCYGSYFCCVTVEQIFYDPNDTLSVGDNVSVCYGESLSLKIVDRSITWAEGYCCLERQGGGSSSFNGCVVCREYFGVGDSSLAFEPVEGGERQLGIV